MVYKLHKIVFITFLSIFATSFISPSAVEAAPCPPGQYQKHQEGTSVTSIGDAFKCANVDSNKTDGKSGVEYTEGNANAGQGGLASVLDVENAVKEGGEGNAGPGWAQKFVRYMVALAQGVGYFTEVAALLGIAYSSYLYTTSEGDVKKLEKAKMFILYAFSGMFVGVFALVIAKMIGGALL